MFVIVNCSCDASTGVVWGGRVGINAVIRLVIIKAVIQLQKPGYWFVSLVIICTREVESSVCPIMIVYFIYTT